MKVHWVFDRSDHPFYKNRKSDQLEETILQIWLKFGGCSLKTERCSRHFIQTLDKYVLK